MNDNICIPDMVSEICMGRMCSQCPIDGYCMKEQYENNQFAKEQIYTAYISLFGEPAVTDNVSTDDIMALFEE